MCDEDDDNDGDIRGSEASDLGHRWTRTVQNHHCKVVVIILTLLFIFMLININIVLLILIIIQNINIFSTIIIVTTMTTSQDYNAVITVNPRECFLVFSFVCKIKYNIIMQLLPWSPGNHCGV